MKEFLKLVAAEAYRISNNRPRTRTTWRVALTAIRRVARPA